jgi:hypothetical protein
MGLLVRLKPQTNRVPGRPAPRVRVGNVRSGRRSASWILNFPRWLCRIQPSHSATTTMRIAGRYVRQSVVDAARRTCVYRSAPGEWHAATAECREIGENLRSQRITRRLTRHVGQQWGRTQCRVGQCGHINGSKLVASAPDTSSPIRFRRHGHHHAADALDNAHCLSSAFLPSGRIRRFVVRAAMFECRYLHVYNGVLRRSK